MQKQEWTEGRRRTFIISVLRGGMRRYPPKWETLKEACVGKLLNKATKRSALHYKCNKCKKNFVAKEVQVDHKKPVVDVKQGFVSYDVFIERLYCDRKNLQVLCKGCHDAKTKRESKRRTKTAV